MSCPFEQNPSSEGYAQERINTIRIHKQRGYYDYRKAHTITDSTLVSHVAFNIVDEEGEDTPVNLPMTCVLGRYDSNIEYDYLSDEQIEYENKKLITNGAAEAYLHGNAASMLYKAIRASGQNGVRVCITSTKVDGIVLFLTPNGHSLNYRSAVLHGTASLVPNMNIKKKRWAMRLLTNHMWSGRWDSTYPVAKSEMQSVQVVEVKIRTASSKIRACNVDDFDPSIVLGQSPNWRKENVWSGVVPVYEQYGEPVSSEVMDAVERQGDAPGLERIERIRLQMNEQLKKYPKKVAATGPVERDMKERVRQWDKML